MPRVYIIRNLASYQFRVDESKPDSFDNNWKNNSLDTLYLLSEARELFRCPAQTVANYCFGAMRPGDTVVHGDTIAPGDFVLRCFVAPRKFHGKIHAITQTRDLDGQLIDRQAMQTTRGGYQNGRWLIHDRYSFAQGNDTRYAWSAGCIIVSSDDLESFAFALKNNGVRPGDEIRGTIVEV